MAAETDSQASEVANTSGVTPDTLEATLKSKLEAQKAEVIDISGWWFEHEISPPLMNGIRRLRAII